MAETLGERELADALRGVIGDEAARTVAARLAELRQQLQAPGSADGALWTWIAQLGSPEGRRYRAALAQRGELVTELAEDLAELLNDSGFAGELALFRLSELPASAFGQIATPPPELGAAERRSVIEASYRQRTARLDEEQARIASEMAELSRRLRDLGELAERFASAKAPRAKPGPTQDPLRVYLAQTTTLALRVAGVPIGTGTYSPAVLALQSVMDWYPMPGDARELLRDLKRSSAWPLLSDSPARSDRG